MDYFQYQGQHLFAENVAVADIAARFGTPPAMFTAVQRWNGTTTPTSRHWGNYPGMICYAVKANSIWGY